MTVFVVNLEHNRDRLVSVSAQLKRFGFSFERFPAVYGKDLSKQERRRQFASFRSWCAMGRVLRAGEIGCALSHCGIYRRMIADNIPIAAVLEDDVFLSNNFVDAIRQSQQVMNAKRPQVIMLSAHAAESKTEGVYAIQGAMCTDGYVLTLAAAKILLQLNFPVVTVADAWPRWVYRRCIELYRVYPTSVSQNKALFSTSEINDGRIKAVASRSILTRVLYLILRVIGKSMDWLWWKILG